MQDVTTDARRAVLEGKLRRRQEQMEGELRRAQARYANMRDCFRG
jgi:hypothetical protein